MIANDNVIKFPTKLKKKDEAYYAACECFNYFDSLYQESLKASQLDSKGVLSGMHNVFGNINSDVKKVFLSFLNRPSAKTWLAARSYLIDTSTTAWQLWVKYDIRAPRYGSDDKYPNPDDFIQYYKEHKRDRLEKLKEKRDEALSVIELYEK